MESDRQTYWIGIGGVVFGFAGGAAMSLLLYLWPNMPRAIPVGLLCFFILVMGAGLIMICAPLRAESWYRAYKRQGLLTGPFLLMSFGVILFLTGAAWQVWSSQFSSEVKSENTKPSANANKFETMPSILSIFMMDSMRALKAENEMSFIKQATTDYELSDNGRHIKIPVLYNIIYHVNQNTKYVYFYVPEVGQDTNKIISVIATEYIRLIDDAEKRSIAVGKAGDEAEIHINGLNFSGRIFLYCGKAQTIQELAEIDTKFKSNNALVQYRGNGYALEIFGQIRSGRLSIPPAYSLKDGLPVVQN